jgi:hypothetical protein
MATPLFIPFMASALSWIFREVMVKFVVFVAFFALVSLVVPRAIGYLGGFASTGDISSAFAGISPSVWYVLQFFRLDFGVPLILSAYASRFLIRRLPLIG